MKKIVLTVVAMLSMTMAFADGENANNINEAEAYNFSINSYKLSVALGLNLDQTEAVSDIEKNFIIEMKNAGEANKEQRPELVKEAVNKNLSYMHAVLNNQQYHKYLTLMNMTLANRGLNF